MGCKPWYCKRKRYIKGCLSNSKGWICFDVFKFVIVISFFVRVKRKASVAVCTETLVILQLCA